LIIFLKSKKSKAGALLSAQHCEPFQALRRSVLGEVRLAGWNLRIHFRSQSGQTGRGVKSSVDPSSGTAGLIRTQNLGIKYRKPTCRLHAPLGGLNLRRLTAGTAGPQAFPRNPGNCFYSSPIGLRVKAWLKKRREIQGGGGSEA
jgi:hypothetical protein